MKQSLAVQLCWGAMVVLIVFWHADWFSCASKYLYFSSEIGLLFIALALYSATFIGMHWSDPPEDGNNRPQPGWQRFTRELIFWFCCLIGVMLCVWLVAGIWGGLSTAIWLKRAIWLGYALMVYVIYIVLVARYFPYINAFALATTTTIMVYLLSTYEVILLDRGLGWQYNNTVIGYIFGIPLDNVLFVYPVSPILAILLYAVVSRRRNNLKAFWLINALMIPGSIIFELCAVYPFNIWRVFTGQSVWPMGKTSIEEFLFLILMPFISIAMYSFFAKHSENQTVIPLMEKSE